MTQTRLVQGLSTTTVATYDYLGTSGVVGVDLPEPDVYGNRFDASGDYTQLDRFNRPTTWTWTKDDPATGPDIDFYDVDVTYNERGDIERSIDSVMADTSGTHYFDRAYTLDAFGRLLQEERGNWTGSAINNLNEDRVWTLGSTGNWATRTVDLDGDGGLNGIGELNELNVLTGVSAHFNNANEWRQRDTDGDGTDDLTLDYDANGNLEDDGETYDYAYDAWNRLATVYERGTTNVVAEYRYNGLGQRLAESDGTTDEYLIYDDRWRLVSRSDGSEYLEETLHHHAGLDGYGGASHPDPPAGGMALPAARVASPLGRTESPAARTALPAGRTESPAARTTLPAGRTKLPAGGTSRAAARMSSAAGETVSAAGGTSSAAGEMVSNALGTSSAAARTDPDRPSERQTRVDQGVYG